ncbi:MAG: hypothetical protein ACFE8U_14340 [Candidatus Hermodarchaeota archaeon]
MSSTGTSEDVNAYFPKLFSTKSVDKSEVVIGENIIVTVIIENFGNHTAYNVTIIDYVPNPWIFNVSGLTQLSYAQIGPNETRQFSYLLTAETISGDQPFKLLGAQIEYYDSELYQNKYTHYTNEIDIKVIEPPEDFSLANFNAAVTFLLILIVLNVFLLIRLIAPKMNRRQELG